MKTIDEIRNSLLQIAEPVCQDLGYELVDITYKPEQGGWIVRVYIDSAARGGTSGADEGSPIAFADCERVSRELSNVFDVEDPVPHAYSLEVSSPGADRPLRCLEHFIRFAGHKAAITLAESAVAAGERRNFTGAIIIPNEDELGDIGIEVDGVCHLLRLADIKSAKLVPDWDQLFKNAKQQAEMAARN